MSVKIRRIRGVDYAVSVFQGPDNALLPIVFLHGFTGTQATYQQWLTRLAAERTVILLDILGHGKSSRAADLERYQAYEQARDLRLLLLELGIERAYFYGYSMGGRLALAFSFFAAEMVAGVILESASPGLATANERQQRRQQDAQLADWIEAAGIVKFVEYWQALPLFRTQERLPAEQQQQIQQERLSQSPSALANSLRGFGTGSQPNYWPHLTAINYQVLLLTGLEDRKFCRLAQEMQRLIPQAEWSLIPEAGHAPHIENPEDTFIQLHNFLTKKKE